MNNRIIKVIYFDEAAAADYLDISNGGKKIEERSKTKGSSKNANVEAKLETRTGIVFDILSALVSTKGSLSVGGGISGISETAIKTTVTKTILNDYIMQASSDKSIKILPNCTIQPYPNSISFFKMYTPYLKMLKLEDKNVDLSKMDETLTEGKGYFEMTKINELGEVQFILRFNLTSFNNNYRLADLTRMQLSYYVVKVGQADPSSMDIEKEFELDKNKSPLTVEKLKGEESKSHSLVPIYDVVLAGVATHE
ncbi:DUF6414 family protein [Owenweeksia hongkongensis]|uniref:DUF6414 family protein n=1 Tax=Owenweeksia hongkongensis TaxID=253245 RepID=UPI003A95869B